MGLDAGRLDDNAANWWRMVHRGRLKSRGKIVGGEHQGQSRRVPHADEAKAKALLAWLPNMHQLGRNCVVMYLWTSTRGIEFLGMRPEHVRNESDGRWWASKAAVREGEGLVLPVTKWTPHDLRGARRARSERLVWRRGLGLARLLARFDARLGGRGAMFEAVGLVACLGALEFGATEPSKRLYQGPT